MPILLWVALPTLLTGLGLKIGADAVEESTTSIAPKLLMAGAGALALYWGYRKISK